MAKKITISDLPVFDVAEHLTKAGRCLRSQSFSLFKPKVFPDCPYPFHPVPFCLIVP